MVDQRRLQISELHFEKFPVPSTSSCWKIRYLFWFTLGSNVVDQRKRDGRFSGRSHVVALNSGISFPGFRDAGREDGLSTEQDHPQFLLQAEGQSGGAESSIARSISSRSTDCLYDLRILPSSWRSWYCSWLRWSIQYYSSQRWCSGIRYALGRFFKHWARFPHMMRWKVCTHYEYVSLINSTRYWNCMNLKFIKDFEARLSQVEVHGEETHRSKRSDHETLMPEMMKIETWAVLKNRRDQRGVERGPGECYQWEAKGQCSKGDNCSFRHDGNKRGKWTPKSAPSSEPRTEKRWWTIFEKKESQRSEPIWEVSSNDVPRLHQR